MAFRIAGRYARALADVIAESSEYRRALDELAAFAAVYAESAELRNLFEAPAVALASKLKVLDTIVHRLGASLATSNFLRVLVKNYRMAHFEEIHQAFHRIANQRLGIVAIRITSAAALDQAQRDAMAARFRELTGKQVEFEFHLDPDLVGGLRAQVGSTVYDGSVRGALSRFKEQLATA
ncbi:MAG TPA: ATP synthase F1 subunit delta [Terriglobia bacterium]|nr:ATP synthase F1 subunit delta [Terriglobia bacterium]